MSQTKKGKILGKEGRSVAVRYGPGVTDILLIRPSDFHGFTSAEFEKLDEGDEVELRYVSSKDYGWWHAYKS